MRYIHATVKTTCCSCLVRELKDGAPPKVTTKKLYITGTITDAKRALRALKRSYDSSAMQVLAVDDIKVTVQRYSMGINQFIKLAKKESENTLEKEKENNEEH